MKNLLLTFVCFPAIVFGQNFYFSGRLGVAGYQGDLKAKAITLSQTKPMFSVGARYDLSEHIAARSYITLASLTGDDKKGTAIMQQRNLNFKSKIFDWELSAQYSLFNLNDRWWT